MLDKLVEKFLKFPGIGPRQAKRFGFFLAGADKQFLEELAKLILEIKKDIAQCQSCFRFYNIRNRTANICDICSSPNRDSSPLMIIEKDVDFENIEKSGAYNGKYFVLGGILSLTNGNGKQNNLRFKELFSKVEKEKPKEIILATSATIEGENTASYAEKILEPVTKNFRLKITRLGRGISTGTELEYVDSETMSNALKNRK